jgi:hypothetical protein
VGEHGQNWENKTHSFFTEYCVIHNLEYHNLFEDSFIENKIRELREKKVKLRKGNIFDID